MVVASPALLRQWRPEPSAPSGVLIGPLYERIKIFLHVLVVAPESVTSKDAEPVTALSLAGVP